MSRFSVYGACQQNSHLINIFELKLSNDFVSYTSMLKGWVGQCWKLMRCIIIFEAYSTYRMLDTGAAHIFMHFIC